MPDYFIVQNRVLIHTFELVGCEVGIVFWICSELTGIYIQRNFSANTYRNIRVDYYDHIGSKPYFEQSNT